MLKMKIFFDHGAHTDIQTGTDRVVGSYHSTDDPTSPQQERLPFHTFKRARSVNLLKGMPTQRTTPSDENSFQIRNINVSSCRI